MFNYNIKTCLLILKKKLNFLHIQTRHKMTATNKVSKLVVPISNDSKQVPYLEIRKLVYIME